MSVCIVVALFVATYVCQRIQLQKHRLILIPALVILAWNFGVESQLDFVCYPNFTIVITNPDPGEYTHLFAVQNEGLSTATKCAVTPDDSYFVIDDCNATNQFINVYLSGRAASADVDTFGGPDTISYLIECNDLASSGAQRIVDASLAVTLEVTTQDPIQPTFTTRMDFRPVGALGNTISSAIVGRMIYWTIDFAVEYYAVPTCRAYAGTDNTGSPSLDLYTDGCAEDFSLAIIDFYYYPDNWPHYSPNYRRLISNIFVFKFYNTDLLYFECVLRLCPNAAACEINCPVFKKRSISEGDNKTTGDFLEFKTGRVFRVSSEQESVGTILTGNTKLIMFLYILWSFGA